MTRKALGRGLEALIPLKPAVDPNRIDAGPATVHHGDGRAAAATLDIPVAARAPEVPQKLSVHDIQSNPDQPRQRFDAATLQELADSIRQSGVLQPLVVRPHGTSYQLVAGERRLRAARLAGLESVPVHVVDVSDEEVLRLAIIENVQREDLNPIEEAHGYRRLMDEFGMSQPDIAAQIGKSRSAIVNTLRLLQLPEDLRQRVEAGELSAGHARALLASNSLAEQIEIADLVRARGLTVRDVERIAQERRRAKRPRAGATQVPALLELQKRLEGRTGTRVRIRSRKADGSVGRVEIEYYTAEDLERLFGLLGVEYLL
jgi:ParB family chromosome partitioning protein